ncbi:Potato inhibitor I family protein [compost metagenome]
MFTEQDKTENVGKPVDDVVASLEKKLEDFRVVKVAMGSFVTMDHRLDRVRVWYNPETNLVTGVTNG